MKKRGIIFFILCSPITLLADGRLVDKVYHPYVQPLERELEWRITSYDGQQAHKLGLGASIGERLFTEVYLIGNRSKGDFEVIAYELEAKWQLTEQGEYSADWGLIAEFEKAKNGDEKELAVGLLVEKEWRKWSGVANFSAIYEWGGDIDNEIETRLALQARYRYSAQFEPAIEFYSSQEGQALGPVIMGNIKLAAKRRLHWEAGLIIGLENKAPSRSGRFLVEFEF